jgi:hypothetical protein
MTMRIIQGPGFFFNPLDDKYHAMKQFNKHSISIKILIVSLTVLATIFSIGLASVGTFRLLNQAFSKTPPPIAQKVEISVEKKPPLLHAQGSGPIGLPNPNLPQPQKIPEPSITPEKQLPPKGDEKVIVQSPPQIEPPPPAATGDTTKACTEEEIEAGAKKTDLEAPKRPRSGSFSSVAPEEEGEEELTAEEVEGSGDDFGWDEAIPTAQPHEIRLDPEDPYTCYIGETTFYFAAEEEPREVKEATATVTEPVSADAQRILLEHLTEHSLGTLGKAVDNGDCFYDSVARLLQTRPGTKSITLKDVKSAIYNRLLELEEQEKKGGKPNWVLKEKGPQAYEEYKILVGMTYEEQIRLYNQHVQFYKVDSRIDAEKLEEIKSKRAEIRTLLRQLHDASKSDAPNIEQRLNDAIKKYNKYPKPPKLSYPVWGQTGLDDQLVFECFHVPIRTYSVVGKEGRQWVEVASAIPDEKQPEYLSLALAQNHFMPIIPPKK